MVHTARPAASKMGKRKEFDTVVLDAVEEGLRQVLGAPSAKMILRYLERVEGLKREEIPRNIEAFSSGLTELLGPVAAPLERRVMKLLCFKLGPGFNVKPGLRPADHVEKLRKRYEKRKGRRRRFENG